MVFSILDKLFLGDEMRNTKYDKIANLHKAPENRLKNAIIAFFSGGVMGFLAELIIEVFCMYLHISRIDSATLMIMFFIFMAAFLTAIGIFDKLVQVFKCGLLIPITGFAHSITSSCLDSKSEGLIYGIGSNAFKLAGSVILYGVVSAWFFGVIRFIIGGVG